MGTLNHALGAFEDSGEHRQLRDSLKPVVDEFLGSRPLDEQIIIYELIGKKVSELHEHETQSGAVEAQAGRLARLAGMAR